MIVVVLVLVLAVLGGAGLLGIGALSAERQRQRTGAIALVSAPVALVGALALAGTLVLGAGRTGPEPAGPGPDPAPAPTTGERPNTLGRSPTTLPPSRLDRAGAELPIVDLRPDDEDRFSPYRPVTGLAPGGVVRVRAAGFGWNERGGVAQCVVELGRRTTCADAFPVQFDSGGRADLQFAIRAEVAPGGCRAAQATCLLRLSGADTGRVASVQVVLVDRPVPAGVVVEPARRVADGQRVGVTVSGLPPGATATAVQCAPPGPYDALRCTGPDPGATFTADPAGRGSTSVVAAAGAVGPGGASCGPRRECAIAVVLSTGFVVAAPVPIGFTRPPGVDYRAGRAGRGLLAALAFVALAGLIAARTDWSPPQEAATPELDGAELRADQSLDDLFGTDAELEERDPIPW